MIWFAKRRSWRHLDQRCKLKVCIIGSSHTASLKLGWELVKNEFPEVELVFFASLGGTMRSLRAIDGKLVSVDPRVANRMSFTSGGHKSIDPRDYDVFVIYGLKLFVPRLERGISRAVMKEVIRNTTVQGLTEKTAGKLRQVTDKTIWIGACPMETTMEAVQDSGEFHAYQTLIDEIATALAVPSDRMLGQPQETRCPDLRTAHVFGNYAQRRKLEEQSEADDGVESAKNLAGELKHMNSEFGACWLRANLPIIMAG
jgi:hypothetical protein